MALSTSPNAFGQIISSQRVPPPTLNHTCTLPDTQTSRSFTSDFVEDPKATPMTRISHPLINITLSKATASKTGVVSLNGTGLSNALSHPRKTPQKTISSLTSQLSQQSPSATSSKMGSETSSSLADSSSAFNGTRPDRGNLPTVTAIIFLVSIIWLLCQ